MHLVITVLIIRNLHLGTFRTTKGQVSIGHVLHVHIHTTEIYVQLGTQRTHAHHPTFRPSQPTQQRAVDVSEKGCSHRQTVVQLLYRT